ncbi:MAG: SMC family ATPase [archaeon]|nr:SMC family ATPase [archaeon]
MLLREIKLHNIRSYISDTITFPNGSTVLSGDIGCGKSTILLAIEFALFGTSRPDLPGELLLRKGTAEGSVELHLIVNNQDLIIKRNLKKDKTGIKQPSGYIIKDGIKKELMPIELKSEILTALGYPDDVLTKNKNYLFRYTVYTPQEEMKFILQESPETRLDVLRKIFNIDKYKNIRENLQIFLKQMRMTIAVTEARIEPLVELQQQLQKYNLEKEEKKKLFATIMPELSILQQRIIEKRKNIEAKEQQQQGYVTLQQKVKTTQALFQSVEEQFIQAQQRQQQTYKELTLLSIPFESTSEQLINEIKILEEERKKIFEQNTSLKERIGHLQSSIQKEQLELKEITEKTATIAEKETIHQELEEKIGKKNEFIEKKKQLDELFQQTQEIITKNKTILEQARHTHEKIGALDTCPTCLQKVQEDHKTLMQTQEGEKISRAENLLFEFEKKRSQIHTQHEDVQKRLEEIFLAENTLTRTRIELKQLREMQSLISEKKLRLISLAQENNKMMSQIQELENKSTVEDIAKRIDEKQRGLRLLTKQEMLNKNHQDNEIQVKELQQKRERLIQELNVIQEELKSKENPTEGIIEERKDLINLQEEERKKSLQENQIKTEINGITKHEEQLNLQISKITAEKTRLIKIQETYHWLEEYFLRLTYTLEKHVLATIHGSFNQFFQEWFTILIDGEEITARIDGTFSPLIEQNGYEIAFQNLSGGEKTSASLAYRLALNRVINDVVHDIKTKDILILDEPTDGFSTEQLDKVRDVLDRLNLKQTIIVSHENKIESFVDNIIRIRKEGHVTIVE